MFYATRPLPNIFALVLVLHALADWLREKHGRFFWASACAVIVFRAEVALLAGCLALVSLGWRRLKLSTAFKHAVPSAVVWLALTVLVDSWFWRRWLWPEAEVFWYNTVLNKSSNWGTSPPLWYFYSVLPRALGASLLFVPYGFVLDVQVRKLVLPAVLFVAAFSFLPHKELRFIIYVFPMLNVAAAVACHRLWMLRKRGVIRRLLAWTAVLHLLVNVAATGGFLYISHLNYPGGIAMHRLHEMESQNTDVNVHIDVMTAQTGVSRFTQLNDNWRYNKTEELRPGGRELLQFTHLLVGSLDRTARDLNIYEKSHSVQATVRAFSRFKLNPQNFPPFEIVVEPRIYLLKRNIQQQNLD